MAQAQHPSILNATARKSMLDYVDAGRLETPEDVARLFAEYTYLIWDHLLFGKVYNYYTNDVVLNYGGGHAVQGIESVLAQTLAAKRGMTLDYQHIFVDIFAEGSPEDGWRFLQATSYHFPEEHGGAPYDAGGRVLKAGQGTCMCECEVRKVDGRWVITQEWMT